MADGDSFEILGTNRIRADDGTPAWDALNSMVIGFPSTTEITFKCLYNAQLSSQQNVYLRTDVNNTNIQTESFAAYNTDIVGSSQMANSNVLGRMIVDNTFVNFTTGTQMEYFVSVMAKQVTHMRLYITDSHNRDIPQNVAYTRNIPDQVVNQPTLGNRSWEGVIKVDIVQHMGGANNVLQSAPIAHTVPARFGTEPLNRFDYGESGFPDVNMQSISLKK